MKSANGYVPPLLPKYLYKLLEAAMNYITITSAAGKNRHYVARTGVGLNHFVMCECHSHDYATQIAAALNLRNYQTQYNDERADRFRPPLEKIK